MGRRKKGEAPPPKRKAAEKSVNQTQPARIDRAEDLLGTGATYSDVQKALVKEFKISARTASRWIAQVYGKWETEEATERPAKRAKLRAQLERALAMAIGDDEMPAITAEGEQVEGRKADLRAVVAITDRLAKLDGLDAPTKLEHSGKVDTGPAIDLSKLKRDERKQLRELLQRARKEEV